MAATVIDQQMIEDSDHLSALDETLGLLTTDEIYEALDIPIVTVLIDKKKDYYPWRVLSGRKTRTHYDLTGISDNEYFDGRLSLDGHTLTLDNKDSVQVRFSRRYQPYSGWTSSLGRSVLDVVCESPREPIICYADNASDLEVAAKRITEGEDLHDAIMQTGHGRGERAYAIWRGLRGWLRAREWRRIADTYRLAAREAGCLLGEYPAVREEVVILNREIGLEEARLRKARRTQRD